MKRLNLEASKKLFVLREVREAGVTRLVKAIKSMGWVPNASIVVRDDTETGDGFIVVEGRHRSTALLRLAVTSPELDLERVPAIVLKHETPVDALFLIAHCTLFVLLNSFNKFVKVKARSCIIIILYQF